MHQNAFPAAEFWTGELPAKEKNTRQIYEHKKVSQQLEVFSDIFEKRMILENSRNLFQ